MDYKKYIKSQALRHKILGMLRFVPDKSMLKLQYRIKFGRWPNFKAPTRYTEKIQLYKLYYRNDLLPVCVDKYRVKEYIAAKGLDLKVPKLFGVYGNAEEIDFGSLPEKCVIKTNDGGGANNVIICRDKNSLDWRAVVKEVNSWLNIKDVSPGREWAYTGIPKSVIMVEELLEDSRNPEAGIEDFKFFCFNGEPYFIQHDGTRLTDHRKNYYDLAWNNLHLQTDYKNFDTESAKPENLDKMISLARELSKDFPHVRVDFYNIGGEIYFGELTFYPYSGYVQFTPDEFDFRLGEQFDINSFMKTPFNKKC